jgi:hypothetical protein
MRRTRLCHAALLTFVAAFMTLAVPAPAAAQHVHVRHGESTDSAARFVQRRPHAMADFAIISTDGRRALLLLPDAVALQLTDAGLEDIASPPAEAPADQGALARVFEGMLRGGLRVLLDRALEYDIDELGVARVDGERLVFVNRSGKPVFENMNIDGQDVMEGFAPADARAFAERVNRRLH